MATEGFVIVENRSGDKIMISEETDQKFNPKNPDICDENLEQQSKRNQK